MPFRIFEPHSALRQYIHHYACCEIGSNGEWSPADITSNGITALAITLRKGRITLRQNGDKVSDFKAITYTGQMTRAIHFDFYDMHKLFFVIFRPCGAFPLLGIHQEECRNSCLNFSDLMGSSARYFEQQSTAEYQAEETKKIIDRFFLQRISVNTKKQARGMYQSKRLTNAIKQITLSIPAGLSIREVCRQTGYSMSTLERRMKKIVGATPKEFQRIMRFNRALQFIKQHPSSLNWPQIAQLHGYYDQTHFIKEFKYFYGLTPADYAAKGNLTLGEMAVQKG